MSLIAGFLPELRKPELTTVIRWLLRAVLVLFLAWLVRRRPEQDEDDENDEDEAEEPMPRAGDRRQGMPRQRGPGARAGGVGGAGPGGPGGRPRGRDPYAPNPLRQRRVPGDGGYGAQSGAGGAGGGTMDFDSIIEKISKPKEMWEVRRPGEGPPQICRPRRQEDQDPSSSPPGNAMGNSASEGADSFGFGTPGGGGGERKRLNLAPRRASGEAKDAQGGEEKMLHGHERPVTFIAWNTDGNLLFTCGKDKLVCVWSVPDGECLGQYRGHTGAVWSCSVTGDSRWLVTCGADRLVIVWEARESRELARVELPGVARGVEWASSSSSSPGGGGSERFAACHNRFGSHPAAVTIFQFDGSAISELLRIDKLPTPASQVRWGRGDDFVVSAHENGELVFWRADTGLEARRLKAHDAAISKFDFSQDREIVATASPDQSVRIWDLGGDGGEWRKIYQAETDRPLNAIALGPLMRPQAIGAAGARPSRFSVIAAGGQDAREVTTSSSTKEQFGTLLFKLGAEESLPCDLQADGVTKGHFGPVHTLAFARDGSAIASGSEDGCVRLHLYGGGTAAAGAGEARPIAA